MSWNSDVREEDELDEIKEQQETSGGPPPGWRPSSETVHAIQGPSEVQNEAAENGEHGTQNVSVDSIDTSDMTHVNGPEDFKKVSYDDMVEGFNKLETVVRPEVEKGAGGDDFYELDQQQGLDYANGYQRVYDAFYGDDAIRLEKEGGDYHVINGAHRLYVARQLGIGSVPAYLIERGKK